MRKTREEKAITLIALIITIVVLLILAVVAINAVTGDGIIQHATNAKTEYEKAQSEEEDRLSYYEGVLQSGEVVPTVEQLDEKYEFEYYASLSDAVKKVNGEIVATVSKENAVAGIYEDSGNKYVVLMKDTEESSVLSVTSDMTLNLGGKTLSFTVDEAYLNFGADNAVIDGRIGGSKIQKNIDNGTEYGLIYGNGNNLTINSGKYIMDGKYSALMYVIESNNKENFEINNSEVRLNNKAETAEKFGAILIEDSADIDAKINNSNINVQGIAGVTISIRCRTGKTDINDSYIYGSSDTYRARGIINDTNSELVVNNSDIYTDASNSETNLSSWGIANQGGVLKFYSGNITGTFVAIYNSEGAETYVYGGVLSGYGEGGFVTYQGANGKAYFENTRFISGEYTGKYDSSAFGRHGNRAILVGGSNANYGSNNVVYIDNCDVVGLVEKDAISLSATGSSTGNILKISNSRITGAIQVDANQTLYLGAGMNGIPDTQITASGTVNRTEFANVSFKRMDKTLMQGN